MQTESTEQSQEHPCVVSVVMPCLNEAATIADCVREAKAALDAANLTGEIVVADNGSTDGSQKLAENAGARVIPIEEKGYGHALIGGIRASRGRFVVMGDADRSYNFSHAPRFVEALQQGNDLVMGNRFAGGIEPGAMPWKNRYIGNPVLSGLGRIFFGSPVRDFHCGLRGFTREAFDRLDLTTGGMEFASEMVIKATLFGMRISEIPTVLRPDGRGRAPHLRPWRDGWRHLRFMLLFSPAWLFLYPGVALMILGCVMMALLIPGPRTIGGVTFDVHTLAFSAAFIVIGFQSVAFWALARTFALRFGLVPRQDGVRHTIPDKLSVNTGIVIGVTTSLAGLFASIAALLYWSSRSFGVLDPALVLRWVLPGTALLTVGLQLVLFSFFLGVLRLDFRR